MTTAFPKIIWQTHNHKKEWLPDYLKFIAATWINLNPGWDYRYVDQVERDRKVSEYPEIYKIYKYLLPIPQSDIWRYIVTYEEGGCYADMDSVCSKPLDYMLEGIQGDPEIIVVPESKGMGNNHNFITKPRSTIIQSVINQIGSYPQSSYLAEFVNTVYSQDSNVSKLFTASSHSMDYKKNFLYEKHIINYYGEEMKYTDFLKQYELNLKMEDWG
jgi:hypothetical protein